MPYVLTILVLNCLFLDTKIIINNVTAAKECGKKWILSTINKKVQPLPALFAKTLLYTPIDKCKVPPINILPIFRLFSIVWISPNFSPNQTHLSPNYHCFHMNGVSLRISNGRLPFQMIFQIHIIYNIRMNIVMYSSKDWSFNQILAYL